LLLHVACPILAEVYSPSGGNNTPWLPEILNIMVVCAAKYNTYCQEGGRISYTFRSYPLLRRIFMFLYCQTWDTPNISFYWYIHRSSQAISAPTWNEKKGVLHMWYFFPSMNCSCAFQARHYSVRASCKQRTVAADEHVLEVYGNRGPLVGYLVRIRTCSTCRMVGARKTKPGVRCRFEQQR